MSSAHGIFNVSEAAGKDQVALETTAAEARISAPNPDIASQIERNANKEKEAAEQAASIAKSLGSEFTGEPATSVDQFKGDASRTTNAAVAEGKRDVEEVKAAGVGYVEQAKGLATSAIHTAQSYLPTAVGGTSANATSALETAQSYLPTSLGGTSAQADKITAQAGHAGQSVFATVGATAGGVYNAVSEAAHPHIEHAKEAAQPHIEHAKGTAQGFMGTAGTQGGNLKPASEQHVPASSAPLESGPHTVDTPYPTKSAGVKGTDIAASGVQPSQHN